MERRAPVAAGQEVVLSAGAIASPQLLLLSGVGPGEQIRRHGIELVHDSAGVGRNLQDHVGAYLTYHVDEPTYNCQLNPARNSGYCVNWLLFGRGPGTTPGAMANAFVRSTPDRVDMDLQIQFTPVGYKLSADALVLLEKPAFTAIPCVNRPFSRGWLELKSANYSDPPRIEPRLLDDSRDLDTLIRGLRDHAPNARCAAAG